MMYINTGTGCRRHTARAHGNAEWHNAQHPGQAVRRSGGSGARRAPRPTPSAQHISRTPDLTPARVAA